jgi:hypothetical protein
VAEEFLRVERRSPRRSMFHSRSIWPNQPGSTFMVSTSTVKNAPHDNSPSPRCRDTNIHPGASTSRAALRRAPQASRHRSFHRHDHPTSNQSWLSAKRVLSRSDTNRFSGTTRCTRWRIWGHSYFSRVAVPLAGGAGSRCVDLLISCFAPLFLDAFQDAPFDRTEATYCLAASLPCTSARNVRARANCVS